MNFSRKVPLGSARLRTSRIESDVGVVDGNVQVGLIVEAGGLIAGVCARGVLFLGGKNFVAADGWIQNGSSGGGERQRRKFSREAVWSAVFSGYSSRSPQSGFAFSLRTMLGEFLALRGQSLDALHHGFGTGFQVRPPSLVSKLFVARAFQMVAWSASVARIPPRSSASGEGIIFQWAPPSVVRRTAPTWPTIQQT